jgi:hypothetical protein
MKRIFGICCKKKISCVHAGKLKTNFRCFGKAESFLNGFLCLKVCAYASLGFGSVCA